MSREIELGRTPVAEYQGVLTKPYKMTSSKLAAHTKIFDQRYLCDSSGIVALSELFGEKFHQLAPLSVDFQYLTSCSDQSHFESSDLSQIERMRQVSHKTTDKIVLKWVVKHPLNGGENYLSVVVRISNPINPLVYLQAALSRSPDDIDNLEFEYGTTSVSVDGAGQVLAEEIFRLVRSWIDSRQHPQYITTIHDKINEHKRKLKFINEWLFPLFVAASFFLYALNGVPSDVVGALILGGIFSHFYARKIAGELNDKIDGWCRMSRLFSMFMITGGDSNLQEKFHAKSRNSTIKLLGSILVSFSINVIAALFTAKFFPSV